MMIYVYTYSCYKYASHELLIVNLRYNESLKHIRKRLKMFDYDNLQFTVEAFRTDAGVGGHLVLAGRAVLALVRRALVHIDLTAREDWLFIQFKC